jgi:hypothetical protein
MENDTLAYMILESVWQYLLWMRDRDDDARAIVSNIQNEIFKSSCEPINLKVCDHHAMKWRDMFMAQIG